MRANHSHRIHWVYHVSHHPDAVSLIGCQNLKLEAQMKHLLVGNILKDKSLQCSIYTLSHKCLQCAFSRKRTYGFRNSVAKGVLNTLTTFLLVNWETVLFVPVTQTSQREHHKITIDQQATAIASVGKIFFGLQSCK